MAVGFMGWVLAGQKGKFYAVFLCKGLSYKIRFFLDLETDVLFLNRMSRYFDIDDIIMEDEVLGSRRRGLGLQGATHGPKTFKLSLASWASCAWIGDRTIGSFLLYAFMNRFKDILSKAHSAAFGVAPRFLPLLTKEEMQPYVKDISRIINHFELGDSPAPFFSKSEIAKSVKELQIQEVIQSMSCMNVDTDPNSDSSSPVPIIGVYVTGVTLVCLLFIIIDIFLGLRNRKIWLPCRLFTLNSVTLAILAVATKLPVNLNLFDAQRS
ncbi:hypothetical protein Scep_007059 [Stephania cephalantha]|uniref:Uncharacterized protein n=1 Tax=Stephania cephalantha TaxID=152367 RepID=A0AAP0K9C2_9MAGN